MIYQVYC